MTKKIDALEALLGSNDTAEKAVYIKRLNADFIVQAIDTDTFSDITEASKDEKGNVNDSDLHAGLVAKACISPNFNDQQLRDKYNVETAVDCVKKALKAGELLRIVNVAMELSGFNEDIESVKN